MEQKQLLELSLIRLDKTFIAIEKQIFERIKGKDSDECLLDLIDYLVNCDAISDELSDSLENSEWFERVSDPKGGQHKMKLFGLQKSETQLKQQYRKHLRMVSQKKEAEKVLAESASEDKEVQKLFDFLADQGFGPCRYGAGFAQDYEDGTSVSFDLNGLGDNTWYGVTTRFRLKGNPNADEVIEYISRCIEFKDMVWVEDKGKEQ